MDLGRTTLPGKTAMACKIPRLQWTDGIIRFHCYWQKLRTAIVLPRYSKSVSDGHWRQFTLLTPEDLELSTRALLHRKLFSDHVISFGSWRHEAVFAFYCCTHQMYRGTFLIWLTKLKPVHLEYRLQIIT